jgi:tetratricopeptide (TPR) repeat protein
MARLADELVGRAAELDALDGAIAGLEGGGPGALVLLGEPGIGKTSLLGELAERADARGHIVLSGGASELEDDLPFWLFVDALDEYVAGLHPRRLESLEDDVRTELALVFPSLAELAGASQAGLHERYRAHRAVRELLQRLAATKPLVLLLDDVHWADPASVELLGALLRRPPAAATLLAMSARPRQLPERLAGALGRADRAGSLTRLELRPLGRDDAGRLLGEAVDRELADALYELLAPDLVRGTDVPRRFMFRHPLVRRVVYETAPGGWRLGAHERCAAALAERGASAAARAHYVEHAARHGDPDALAVLREAGGAAVARAPAIAARWFGAALRVMPESAPAEERVELLLARAQALGATGQLEESRADLLESLALVPDELVAVRVRLTVACAGVEHMLGRYAEARARITAVLGRIPDAATPAAVALMIVLAFDGLFRADFDSMGDAAERALEVARPLGDLPLTATAAAVLTLARAWGGAIEAAEATRAEAVALVDAMSDEELAGRIDAAAHLAAAELYMDRYDDAGAHAERALAAARATGQDFPTLIPILASAHFMRGRLAEATEVIDRGIESARLTDIPQDLAWRLHIRSSAALAAGDLDTAFGSAEEAVELTGELDGNFVSAYPGLGLAAALLAAGDPARAVVVLAGSAGGEELPLIPRGWRPNAFELLARCHLELGPPRERRARSRPRRGHRRGGWPADCRRVARARRRCGRARRGGAGRGGEASARVGQRGGERRRGGRGRALKRARRPGLGPGRRRRPRGSRVRARRHPVRGMRRAALPRRGRARAAQARPPHPPAHAPGRRRRGGP